MIGSRTGKSPTVDSVVTPMVPSISLTSVDVPPMSKPMMRGYPAATATACAPTAPAAGPDRIVCTAACFARDAEIDPPFDCMMLRRTPAPAPCRAANGLSASRSGVSISAPGAGITFQPLFQRRQIPRHQRRDVGVDDGGAEAFEFAVFRQHAMRGGHGEAGALEVRGDRFLVRRIDVGVQQADRDGVDIAVRGTRRRAPESPIRRAPRAPTHRRPGARGCRRSARDRRADADPRP